VQKLNFELKT